MRSSGSLPASILEKSRMSSRTPSNVSADVLTMFKYSPCSGVSSVPRASSVIPMSRSSGCGSRRSCSPEFAFAACGKFSSATGFGLGSV